MITRRAFVKTTVGCLAAATALPLHALAPLNIGISAISYQSLPIDEMIAQLKILLPMNGLNNQEIEMSRKEFLVATHPSDSTLSALKQQLTSNGIRVVSYYSGALANAHDIDDAVRIAKALGARTISGDPAGVDLVKQIDQAVTQNSLSFGIHNGPAKGNSPFTTPDDILKALDGLSSNTGATVDTGHFAANGQDPVEAVRKLNAKIKIVHLKDIKATGDNENVLLGKGIAKIKDVEAELHSQNFRRMIAVEYEKEGNANTVIEDMQKNVGYAWEFGFSGA